MDKMVAQRVVITGAGVVSTHGDSREIFFDNLLAGKSGAIDLTAWKPGVFDDLPTRIGAPVQELDYGDDLTAKEARRMDRVHQYAICAGKRALRDAGLWGADLEALDKTQCGVLVGSAMGGMQVYEDNVMALNTKGIKKVSPFTVPYLLTNMSGAILGMQAELGFRGPNYAVNTACATSNYQFINAATHIRAGQADLILAGGTEAACTRSGLGGFIACRALSSRNDDPTGASRPWDKGRDGFVMGEGAGVLVMESLAHAKKRNATILGEYLGGGISTDAYDLTAPRADGRDVILCMRSALADAGLEADAVDLVNAHGTSTPVGDLCEVAAINAVFGSIDKARFRLNSTKSMLGHSLGAAGALEAVACLQSIGTGRVHPTINHDDPEEGVDFDVVANEAQDFKVKVALSNSFGFGGHNSSVLFGAFEG
ncbi:predicted protein [Micromonas commoda]|uniref:3-oxoacyl-[acyl-carrier-protein] synthase n=1 Tax=Micromonas commoda (strain RCC299 / NOUM17 / CCMP2709) TaxID=296587 RepID=C1FJS8_MICCC|nr:predicted protein [Micromonas commoda]ACO70398.1 predicted protein [Micromonas commoda]|eukprot:XP_002509140.1 predicted protein [Micromonas commoda]